MSRRIVIIGGGISGLAFAHAIRHGVGERPGDEGAQIDLVESAERLGGLVHTIELDGLRTDVGADAFLARRPEGRALAAAVGLGDDLIAPAVSDVRLWIGEHLRPLPAQTVLGVPTSLRAVARARVMSPAALARAGFEWLMPRSDIANDVSVGDVVAARWGRTVVDRLIDPLLGGVYAGNANELSLASTSVALHNALVDGRRATPALRQTLRASTGGPVFETVRGGLARMVDAVHAAADAIGPGITVHQPDRAVSLQRVGDGWQVALASGQTLAATHVVLATPTHVSAELMAEAAPEAGAALRGIEHASVATVTVSLDEGSRAPIGSGLLVPRDQARFVKAVTVVSNKWAPLHREGRTLVRASIGRHGDGVLDRHEDDEIVARVVADLRAAYGADGEVRATNVARWDRALPQYNVGHSARIETAIAALRTTPGLTLIGNAVGGVGVAPCIATARTAASSVLAGR